MLKIELQEYMDGFKRIGKIKDKVNGYKKIIRDETTTFFSRGKILYVIENDNTGFISIKKLGEDKYTFLEITYDEFRKFIDVIVLK